MHQKGRMNPGARVAFLEKHPDYPARGFIEASFHDLPRAFSSFANNRISGDVWSSPKDLICLMRGLRRCRIGG